MPNKNPIVYGASALALLLVPLVAMLFTDEVRWDITDFVVMGVLLFVAGTALGFAARMRGSRGVRLMVAGAILLGFVYVWAELAVGIFFSFGS